MGAEDVCDACRPRTALVLNLKLALLKILLISKVCVLIKKKKRRRKIVFVILWRPLTPGSLAGRRRLDSEAAPAQGARSCSAFATATPPSCGWWRRLVHRSLRQVHLLQRQACWRVVVTGPGQKAHEMFAVPRQAACMCRTRQQPPTLGSMVAWQILASEGQGDPWGCGRKRRGRRVPAAQTVESRVMDRRWTLVKKRGEDHPGHVLEARNTQI